MNTKAEYLTICSDKNQNAVLHRHIYEADSIDDAINQAFNGCAKEGYNLDDISVRVNRIFFSL